MFGVASNDPLLNFTNDAVDRAERRPLLKGKCFDANPMARHGTKSEGGHLLKRANEGTANKKGT
jgi:hypothetical protein